MKLLFLSIIILLLYCCHSPESNKLFTPVNNLSEKKRDSFFPVTSFLKGQIAELITIQVTPLHIIAINNKTDSVWIKRSKLSKHLAPFLSFKISETNLVPFFKETSFKDLTLNSITLTYDPIKLLPDSIEIKHWEVHIDPENGKIKKIYLLKQIKDKANLITEQLTWETDKSATITTLINKNGNKMQLLKVNKFIWNFTDY